MVRVLHKIKYLPIFLTSPINLQFNLYYAEHSLMFRIFYNLQNLSISWYKLYCTWIKIRQMIRLFAKHVPHKKYLRNFDSIWPFFVRITKHLHLLCINRKKCFNFFVCVCLPLTHAHTLSLLRGYPPSLCLN